MTKHKHLILITYIDNLIIFLVFQSKRYYISCTEWPQNKPTLKYFFVAVGTK
jgi:hypothetical protein